MSMLTQEEANVFINSLKRLLSEPALEFPNPGKKLMLECKDGKNNKYAIDIVRGRQKPSKATYQTRYNKATVLIRVDIDGPPHDNPDGEEILCPHIHIYREGFEDKWAYPLDKEMATNSEDLIQVLIDFLAYNNISNMHEINIQGGDLLDGS
ncbi:Uncharacterised protein [Streptococcus pneumoniae]|nr:Uncharacterised protein [Streptococcus pneumoniae]CGF90839.1 Uncharacterised protein [Streptococcus pneumoniae]CJA50940.1 Uncharacterised protein [Streptococcus pneumoniae]CJA74947.1 Uncharacterised protein [Streptococcus pneumoniae]CJA99163.1 Uncharacterised protein [Streptococcus pneumoniae]